MSEQDNTQLNNQNVSKSWDVSLNNSLVNEAISHLQGYSNADLHGTYDILTAPFIGSYMSKGSVIGGGYKIGAVELYKNSYNNKSLILDEMTLSNLSKESGAHLYFTNGIYATSKAKVIEEANRFAAANNCDEVKFTENGKDYSMFKAEFDFFYRGHKRFTKIIKVDDKSIISCKKENLRGFIGYNIDIDNVDYERAENLRSDIENQVIPAPTIIIVTGTGIHLWYIFREPIYLKNQTTLKNYEIMQGMFSRKFTHNERYCGKEEETGSFQRDLPLGQPMRATGNIYNKIEGLNILTESYVSGSYYDVEELNRWADIPKMKIGKVRSAQQYNMLKTRILSVTEYEKLKNSFVCENVHFRTQHRNLLFYYMLVKENLSFEDALTEINLLVDELNNTRPVEGNYVRHLEEREAKKFNPYCDEFDYKYYQNHLSVSALVNTPIYKKWIKKTRHHTGLNRVENQIKVNKEIVHKLPQKSEKFLYAILNYLQGTKKNYSGIIKYNNEQCVINDYDFTPFVVSHSDYYELGTDPNRRELRRLYSLIEDSTSEKAQRTIRVIYEYLLDGRRQRIGDINVYSLSQQFIHKFLLASTEQSFRDDFYSRYNGFKIPKNWTIKNEEDYREIHAYVNSLMTLTHHHFEKIRDNRNDTPSSYITGDVLDYNWTRTDETIMEMQKLLRTLEMIREEVLKTTDNKELIAEMIKTNKRSENFKMSEQTIILESLLRRIHFESIKFSNVKIKLSERIRLYNGITNILSRHQEIKNLDFDTIFNIFNGIHFLSKQARNNKTEFVREMRRLETSLLSKVETIKFIDRLILNNINNFSEGKRKYHGTFMYMCYLRGYVGFYDNLLGPVNFPYNGVLHNSLFGLEHCNIGRKLFELDNSHREVRTILIWNFKERCKDTRHERMSLREQVILTAIYINNCGQFTQYSQEQILDNIIDVVQLKENNSYFCRTLAEELDCDAKHIKR